VYYLEVFNALNNANIRYVVIGGTAIVLYGVPRSTHDVDLLLAMDETNLLKAIHELETLGYKTRLPVKSTDFASETKRKEWMEQKNMQAFTFHKSGKEFLTVDFVFGQPIDFDSVYERRILKMMDGIEIPLISVDDLIELKKNANRKQDISDIESLNKLRR
jgi:predicted nucleotidyltransferase